MLLAVLLLVAVGCQRSGERGPAEKLDTVEVGEGFDAGLTTAFDQKAKQVGGEKISGVLPQGFPRDLPLYTPSSLVDFGEADAGMHYLEFDTSDGAAVVRRRLEADLANSGWRPLSADLTTSFVKGDRQVTLAVRDLSPGARIRYVYSREP
ncbi:MAG: hypothetical protein EP299_13435 [Acidobacteria bacterium]|nr:MAG: hypothetical protein EP299_13435 [Acidobacteriota bacterium]